MISRARMLQTLGASAAAAAVARPRTIALAQSPVVLRCGTGNVEANAQVFYALEQGFFRKNGIDVDISLVRTGAIVLEGVAAGQLEFGAGNPVSVGSAILRTLPFVVIAPGMFWDASAPNGAIVVAPNSPVKSIKDLAGKTLGVISLRNVGELAFETYFDQAGVEQSSVKYVELAPSQMAEAVATGRIAAGTMLDPELSSALGTGKVKRLVSAYDGISKLFYLTVWFTSRDWLAKNRESAKRVVDALLQGGTWAEANREQSLVILAKYTKVKEGRTNARYGRRLDPALLQPVWDAASKHKIYDGPLRAAEHCWDGA